VEADPALCHPRSRDSVHDPLDLDRVRHPGDPTRGADVRRDALEGHHRDRTGFFGNQRLLRVRDVHHDAAFLHLREAALEQFGPESEFAEVQVEGHDAPRSRATSRWVFLCCYPRPRKSNALPTATQPRCLESPESCRYGAIEVSACLPIHKGRTGMSSTW